MAAVGALIGVGAAAALVWNEWGLARRFSVVDEARRRLAEGGPGPVHLIGEARAAATLRDPAFNIEADALRLDRTAQTFQWREEREGSGDNRRLRYERVWSAELIASQRFEQRLGHANPDRLRVASAAFAATEIDLAGRRLAPGLVDLLPATRELRPDRAAGLGLAFARGGDWLYSGDPSDPRIGDVRLRFAAAPEGTVSIVAGEIDGELAPWPARSGEEVALLAYGEIAAASLLAASARGDWRSAWIFRGFGGLAMTIAAMFWLPALAARSGRKLRGGGRIGTMLLLGVGAAAVACAVGWAGARLLLIAGGA